jgi:hypothetical protein
MNFHCLHCDWMIIMTDVTQTLCLVLLVVCLGGCFMRAVWEFEQERQRRRERKRMTERAMRAVSPVIERGRARHRPR